MPDPWERGGNAGVPPAKLWPSAGSAGVSPAVGRRPMIVVHTGEPPVSRDTPPWAKHHHGSRKPCMTTGRDTRETHASGVLRAGRPRSQEAATALQAGRPRSQDRSRRLVPAMPGWGRFTSGLLRDCRLARPRAVSRPACSGAAVPASAAWDARREPLRLPAPDPFRIPPSRNGPPCPPAPGCFAVAAWLGAPCPPPAPIRRAGSGSWHGLPGPCEPDPLGGTGSPRRRQSGCPWALRVRCFRHPRRCWSL